MKRKITCTLAFVGTLCLSTASAQAITMSIGQYPLIVITLALPDYRPDMVQDPNKDTSCNHKTSSEDICKTDEE